MERSAGILLPLFSLPNESHVGTMGRDARAFVDFLAEAGCRWWQMLPINPIDRYYSPYSNASAFAGEPLYLDLEELADEGLLDRDDLPKAVPSSFSDRPKADYEAAGAERLPLYQKAFARYRAGEGGTRYRVREETFLSENVFWLDDYTFFCVLADRFGTTVWPRWPKAFRDRDPEALVRVRRESEETFAFHRFTQLVFDTQWCGLKEYCNTKGVRILGDVPIYVGMASADTWTNRQFFRLDDDGWPRRISGAPADAFSPDGQRWDSPLYNWSRLEETGFDWWLRRLDMTLRRFDAVRLDHFIGFYNYYSFPIYKRDRSIPVGPDEPTDGLVPTTPIDADGGFWTAGPREKFLDTVFAHFPKEAFIAEDLGVMTPGVHALRDHYQLPGMKVLVFAYEHRAGTDPDPMTEVCRNSVACTGTHDTQTVRGWLEELRNPESPIPVNYSYVAEVFGRHLTQAEATVAVPSRYTDPVRVTEQEMNLLVRCGVREVLASRAETALVPIQDFLGLDDTARVNSPGRIENNWLWHLGRNDLSSDLAASIRNELEATNR